ncbi:MAG: 4Fe-4S binding protein [Holosporales bacterium]|nr:4Fe-4S binding protein [Holosporales bacterium]
MIRKFLNFALLIDIVTALFVGLKCCFKKPVTKNLNRIKRSRKFRKVLTFDAEKCVGCKMCSEICPSRAIQVQVPGKHEYNPRKCCYCGLCQSACRFGAIKFSNPSPKSAEPDFYDGTMTSEKADHPL